MQNRSLSVLPLLALAWACGGQSLHAPGEGESGAGGDSGKGGSSNTGGTASKGGSGGTGSGGVGGTSAGGTGAIGGSGSDGGTGAIGGSGSDGGTGAIGGSGSDGGTGAIGGSGAIGGTGAGGSGGSAGSGQCLAFPTCPAGEYEVPTSLFCNEGAVCHQVSLCGTTIVCTGEPLCDAIPFCDAEDEQLDGECPPDGICYTRTVCGQTIHCLDHCNPETEPNRQYLLTSCAPGDGWKCDPPATTSFVNDCGCGCEQASSCPANLSCRLPIALDRAAPPGSESPPTDPNTGATAPPFCTDEQLTTCPFSDTFDAVRP